MKKLIALSLCALLCATFLFGCGSKPLPDGFSEETVLSCAREIVSLLEEKDFDAITTTMDDTLLEAAGENKLQEVWEPYAEKLGAFTGMEKESTFGQDGYAVAVLVAAYENGTAQFTISYDSEMKLAGFYVK